MVWSKMGSVPNPVMDSNGDAASGYVLKCYLPGTTTATSIATDSTGNTLVASMTTNAAGVFEVSGNEIIPHIDRKIKWGIFANSTDAAANTPFAIGPFDNVDQSSSSQSDNPIPAFIETQLGSAAVSRVFTLTLFSYTVGATNTANLMVFRNGQKLTKGVTADYTETSSTSVTLTFDPNDNDSFDFIASTSVSTATSDAALVTYTPAGTGAVATDVQTKLRESVSVKDFGAVGDGATDDTAAIQAALSSLTSGGTVRVPASATSYMIDATTAILPLANTNLVIEKGATLEAIANSSDNYQIVHVDSVSNVAIYGGGTIKGERTGHIGSTGEGGMCIRTDNADNVSISDLELTEGWGDGIYIGGSGGNSSNIKIHNNRIHNNRRNNISVVDGDYGVISGNIIYNANGTNPESGIDLEPGKNENVRNWTVTGNTVFDNNNTGIVAVTPWEPAVSIVRDITISGNTCYSNGAQGISAGRMLACTISGNTCNDNTTNGIQVASGVHKDASEVPGNGVTSDILVSGNTCYNNTEAGVYINGTNTYTDISEVQVTGNVCSNNTTYGIKVDRVAGQTLKDISIDSNTCHENTLAGIYCNRTIDMSVRDNTCNDNGNQGIHFTGSASDTVGSIISGNSCVRNTDSGISAVYVNDSVINNNKCKENGEHGIISFEGHDSTITGNSCLGNSQTTDATYNGIYLERSDDCVVSANICRHQSLTNQQKYGIEIEATAERNLVTGNNIVNSGRTGSILDSSGTSTVNNNLT